MALVKQTLVDFDESSAEYKALADALLAPFNPDYYTAARMLAELTI